MTAASIRDFSRHLADSHGIHSEEELVNGDLKFSSRALVFFFVFVT
jgi:hypothetical protein